MKYIAAGWESYLEEVVPKDASKMQLSETRQAFYAGSAILFQVLMIGLSPGDDVEELDITRLEDLQAELIEFGQQLDLKYVKPGGSA